MNDGRSGTEILPDGDYTEHDIWSSQELEDKGAKNRGADRIVYDIKSGRGWFTSNHYKKFVEILDEGGEEAENIEESVE